MRTNKGVRMIRSFRTTGIFLTALVLAAMMQPANAQTFTIINNCNQTIYPAILPAAYQNGGWSMAPNTTVSFPVSATFSGRVWSRKNCNTGTSPAQCDTGSCGGTGLQCAGTSGQGSTSLAEFTLAGVVNGTDWYDVSNVDAYDFPIAITTPTGGYSPTVTADVLAACPSVLQVKNASGELVDCQNPCNVYKSPLVCGTSQTPQNCRDGVSQWPAPAQQWVNDIHNNENEDYAYPYDDWWGLHTESSGANPAGNTWTITFCPNNVQPDSGNTADNWPVAPTGMAATSSGSNVVVTWNAVSGATSYDVYRSTTAGANNATSTDTPQASGLTGASYTDTTTTSGTTYYYIVTAVNSSGFSAPSSQLIVTAGGTGVAITTAPTGVTATAGNGLVTLTWSAVAGATSYSIFDATTSNGEPTTPAASNVTGTSYTITGLTNNTLYYFFVAGNNAAGMSPGSTEVSATPVAAAGSPGTPTGLTGTPGNAQVSLTWNTVSGATSYSVFRATTSGGEGTTPIASGLTGAAYTNTGLTNGVTYYYTVEAINASGPSSQSSEVHVTPFNSTGTGGISIDCGGAASGSFVADTDFSGGAATSVTNTINTAQLTGTIPAQAVLQSNRYGVMTYTITGLTGGAQYPVTLYFAEEYWTAAGQRVFNVSANGLAELTNFDIFATAGAEYTAVEKTFNVISSTSGQIQLSFTAVADNPQVNAIVVGSGSGGGGTAPSAPTGLGATAGNAQVSLSWTGSSGATSYNVYRGTTAGGESGTALASGLTGTTYTDTSVTNGTTYYYKVAAVNSSGTSGMSNEASATPAGGGTTGLVSIDCGGGASGSFVADTDFTGGTEASTTATISTSLLTGTVPSQAVLQSNRYGAMTYTIPGLTSGTTYAVTLYFAEEYWTASGKREFNLSANGTSELTNFDIFATAGGENIAIQKSFNVAANSSGQIVLTFTNVIDNAQVNGLVVANTVTPPAAPTGLTATAGNAQVALGWTGSTGATSYNVYRGTSSGGEGTSPIASGLTGTSYTDTAVANGTTYYYTAAAVNAGGTSAQSGQASATPTAPASGGISIDCGGAASSPFVADTDFTGSAGTQVVTNAINTSLLSTPVPPQAVLQSNRYGTMTYTIPGLTAGTSYPVTLYFVEEYWTAAGKRVFNVSINGTQVLTNFDIYANAGAEYKAIQENFSATANSSGQVVITLTSVTDNAQINAIVVN